MLMLLVFLVVLILFAIALGGIAQGLLGKCKKRYEEVYLIIKLFVNIHQGKTQGLLEAF